MVFDFGLFQRCLQHHEGKEVLFTIERFNPEKTSIQRGFYFAAVVRAAAEFFGWEEWEMHDWLKEECNKVQLVNPHTGEIFHIAGSTVPLNKTEMSEFIDRAIRKLAETGFVVKTPDEYFESIHYQEKEM